MYDQTNQPDQATQDTLNDLTARISRLESTPKMPDHRHNGFDASRVQWADITSRSFYVHHTIQGSAAATATNYGTFWIAPFACRAFSFQEVHQTLGTDGGTVSLTLEKLTGTQAPDSGVAMLSAALSLKTTINTVQTGTMTTTLANVNLAKGDRLCMKDAGVLTVVANVSVIVGIMIV
jgi:hypothetical protein